MKRLLTLLLLLITTAASAQNIKLVKDIVPGYSVGQIATFKDCNNNLYFVHDGGTQFQLWRTNGDNTNTVLLCTSQSSIVGAACYNNKLYFIADDGIHGNEIWVTDGSVAGTQMLIDIYPGINSSFYPPIPWDASFTLFNNKLYFIASDGVHGSEVWESDGTAAGTQMAFDLKTAGSLSNDGASAPIMACGNKLFFTGRGDDDSSGLASSDGTLSGTHIVKRIFTSPGYFFIPFNNKVVFDGGIYVNGAVTAAILISDGTDAGTYVLNMDQGVENDYAIYNNKLYFVVDSSIYFTDGTLAGTDTLTTHLQKLSAGTTGFSYYNLKSVNLTPYNNKLYFSSGTLWESDGTAQGTQPLTGLSDTANPQKLMVTNNKLYFLAKAAQRIDVWETDGIQFNKITDPNANSTSTSNVLFTTPLYVFNNEVYYSLVYQQAIGGELYKMDFWPADVFDITSSSVQVFPNPAQQFITVDAEHISDVTVFDVTGKAILHSKGKRIDVRSLANGIYTVIANTATEQLCGRFLKD